MNTQSWSLAQADTPKKFDSLMRGDFAQLKFLTTEKPGVSESLWVEVIGRTNNRDEYWAVLDDKPELITDMPVNYQPIFKPCHVVDFIAQDRDGLALVDLWGQFWGRYKCSHENDYAIESAFGLIQDSGDLGVIGSACFRGNKALRHESKDAFYFKRGHWFAGARVKSESLKRNSEPQFDRAYKAVCKKSSEILLVHYAIKATLKDRVAALDITVHEYFPTLRDAQEEILGVIVRNGVGQHGR